MSRCLCHQSLPVPHCLCFACLDVFEKLDGLIFLFSFLSCLCTSVIRLILSKIPKIFTHWSIRSIVPQTREWKERHYRDFLARFLLQLPWQNGCDAIITKWIEIRWKRGTNLAIRGLNGTDWVAAGGRDKVLGEGDKKAESGSREIPAEVTLLFWGLKSPHNPTPLAILSQTGPTKAVKEIRTTNLSEGQSWAWQTSPTDPTHCTNAEEENTEITASLLCNPVGHLVGQWPWFVILFISLVNQERREREPLRMSWTWLLV